MSLLSLKEYTESANYYSYQDHKIAYWYTRRPRRKFLVFLHGFPSASWDWHTQWQHLREDYNLLALDFLGFGLSSKPAKHVYSIVEQAQIVTALLQHLDIREVSIIAHDYGVSVAQHLLLSVEKESTLSIDKICFLNGGLFASMHRPLRTQKLLHSWLGPLLVKFMSKRSLHKSFTKIFGPKSPPSKAMIDTLWQIMSVNKGQRVLPRLLDYLDERSRYQRMWIQAMRNTQIPLVFINGAHDPISGEHMRKKFEECLPLQMTHSLEVGHYPQLEASEQVNQLLSQFLAQRTS